MSLSVRCGSCIVIPGLMAEVINIILYHLTTELKPDEVGIIWDISGDKKQKFEIWLTIQLLPPQISYIILIISQSALSRSAAGNSFSPCWVQMSRINRLHSKIFMKDGRIVIGSDNSEKNILSWIRCRTYSAGFLLRNLEKSHTIPEC